MDGPGHHLLGLNSVRGGRQRHVERRVRRNGRRDQHQHSQTRARLGLPDARRRRHGTVVLRARSQMGQTTGFPAGFDFLSGRRHRGVLCGHLRGRFDVSRPSGFRHRTVRITGVHVDQ